MGLHAGARHQAVVGALGHQRHAELARDGVDPPETRVVARGLVLRAGIAQADEQKHQPAFRKSGSRFSVRKRAETET